MADTTVANLSPTIGMAFLKSNLGTSLASRFGFKHTSPTVRAHIAATHIARVVEEGAPATLVGSGPGRSRGSDRALAVLKRKASCWRQRRKSRNAIVHLSLPHDRLCRLGPSDLSKLPQRDAGARTGSL